jgi:putative N6-adenine-specific DNA methylase
MMRANLWLRTATRVLVRVAEFRATAFYELEKQAKKIDWAPFLGAGVAPEFRVTAKKSKLYHSDGIAERLMLGVGSLNADPTPDTQHQLFVVRAHRDVLTISADTSGELLHMRGYRRAVAKAPLRETLGAALLLAAEWSGERPLLDPFCGSGTIPIEAALIARRIAPGRQREFAFQRWRGFDARLWTRLVAEADASALPSVAVAIAGSDRDAGAIESAHANAERAGVLNDVTLEVRPLSAVRPTAPGGLIVTNPPYGKRIGGAGRGDVRDLYAQLGNVVRRNFDGWTVTFLAAEERMAAQLGLPLETLFRTSNGGIKVSVMRAR